jgi:hypothetical protein
VSLFLFVFAVWFTAVTFPIWFVLGSIYGLIIAVIKGIGYISQIIGGYFKYGEYGEGMLALLFVIPIAIWDGMKAFLNPVSFAWDFARYDHPVWAFFISLCLTIFYTKNE